nr:MAG TPA: hypothetical protein [Caudoviricetes sp.]
MVLNIQQRLDYFFALVSGDFGSRCRSCGEVVRCRCEPSHRTIVCSTLHFRFYLSF